MKLKNIILLSIIICIGGIALFFVCKATYNSKVDELKKKAEEAFYKALEQELTKRLPESDISFNLKSGTMIADAPDSVYLEDETGRHLYMLDPKKNQMNITTDRSVRALHSIALGEKPLLSDSINLIWSKQLQESGISFESALCISLIGTDGNVKSRSRCQQSKWCHSSNLVFTCYIGYACEIEVMGYLNYSVWSLMYKFILFYLLLDVILVYSFYKSFFIFRRKIHLLRDKYAVEIVKEVPVEVVKEVPIEVLVIKEIQKIEATSIHPYKLSEHTLFYADRNIVEVDGVERNIQPQSSRLLELFLKEGGNEYTLEASVIIKKLWPDKSGNDQRMQKAVGRLRSFIHEIDPSLNIINKLNAYQLIFIENQSIEYTDENVD